MDNLGLVYFPNQKIPTSKKNEEWCKRCIDAAENLLFFKDPKIAKSRRNKVVNYNLLNGQLMDSDIHDLFNPFGIDGGTAPTNIQSYNLVRSKVDLLAGEEFKRNFDWKLYSVNQDSVSLREEHLKDKVFEVAVEALKNKEMDEAAIERRLKSLEQYMKYQYQDLREITGTRILEHLWYELRLKPLFNRGIYDALTVSEEIYRTDIIGGRPVLERVNPLNFEALMMGSSTNIEDAEITVEYSYKGIGKIVEEYYDYLTEQQIDKLEKGNYTLNNMQGRPNMWINQNYEMPVEVVDLMYNKDGQSIAGLANSQMFDGFGTYINERGELRVLITRWKSRIPRYILSMIDPDSGDKIETLVSEYFKVTQEMKDMGVTVKKIWVNEWYEGVKVGQDIYLKMGPRKVQFRNMINPAIAKSGYVGGYYNINDSRAYSLVDRMKPFQYLYNVIMRRVELAIAAWKPPITEINLALKPNDWTLEEWMHYLANGFSIINPFNTITEGPAKGTIVGTSNTFNQGARAVPSDS
ncbi:hypothetical protein, partial [Romboutsia sp.]|uniref:hypothetical protein n=1 Tax=Romboutsia sp. TaxID=1965302 RepID=UPI003F346675